MIIRCLNGDATIEGDLHDPVSWISRSDGSLSRAGFTPVLTAPPAGCLSSVRSASASCFPRQFQLSNFLCHRTSVSGIAGQLHRQSCIHLYQRIGNLPLLQRFGPMPPLHFRHHLRQNSLTSRLVQFLSLGREENSYLLRLIRC
jgi:hypothetical protein